MKRKKQFNGILFILLLIIITVSIVLFFGLVEKLIDRQTTVPESPYYTDTGKARVYYKDSWYTENDALETVLILGIDTIETEKDNGFGQADFIVLLVVDKHNESFRLIHINRDTMTEINQIDKNGTRYGVFNAQLALAHTYGSEGRMQCRNTVDAVEKLMYGINIDHFMSVTMDAVAIVNDSMGGVTVTLAEDFPALGEGYVKGTEVTLKGDQALTYVRFRNNEAEKSNLERMERQRQYISAVFEQYTEFDTENALDTMLKINDYLVSDCTANQLSALLDRLHDYEYAGTAPLAGEAVMGDEFVEFYVDEDALRQLVVDTFYEKEA